ncbi:MAG: gamma-glutamyl-gamma-aminobutyrate hydrolase family protein [Helicobacteraceae bacterium]|nr:gamma-glutamyl-gamma-aminobutyrate hydrolase family protein [Helicobacteraceae bacterium]
MKKIAITQRLVENSSYYEIRESLDIKYCKLVDVCQLLPIVLPYEVDFINYFDDIGIDGVILTGGNDLDVCNINELSKKRDDFEKKLLEYCIVKEIPIFGICRGMQIIASFFGSTFKMIDGEVNKKEKIMVNSDSQYSSNLYKIDYVNSYHNFEIDQISDDFIVVATNKNSVIKAIEHKKYKIFAQMWHSEREKVFDINQINLIKEFFR